ncbi:glycerol-3-phosphate dehydrogenase subunit GlpB [Acerihabitans arboris]|uniref:Anaerobic glycerol-3-phosphate dehydrogenase subunit B n=1 Tax=Acerihabitans arboris TaxID=2691583 RepID=A0A845SLW6_9GAMM|nr:glycerol-3-phosphate dehydrogenase subunit GlpB [Acerihabitans arboris]NDL62265.1 glycerol-3-phosphate dehydrogenase subunit GlpB [Acerihabitans arboris]
MKFDAVVIGGGLAGLSCAISLAEQGLRPAVVSAGQSALFFSSGSLDLLARLPDGTPVASPPEALAALAQQAPHHPYSLLGAREVMARAAQAQALLARCDIALVGRPAQNHLRVTPLGTRRATWLSPREVPVTPWDGALPWQKVVIVGIEGFLDFEASIVAASLAAEQGLAAGTACLRLPALDRLRANPSEFRAVNIARVLDLPESFPALAAELSRLAGDAQCLILPACIGLDSPEPLERLRAAVDRPIYLLPTLPPSLLGMRLYQALRQRLNRLGGVFMPGDRVLKAQFDGRRIVSVTTRNHADIPLRARQVVLAGGSFFSNGLATNRERVYEPVFGLDVHSHADRDAWSRADFFVPQPYLQYGVKTDNRLRALLGGEPIENLYAVGAVLGGYDPLSQGCGAGVSLVSALHAAGRIALSLEENHEPAL